MANKMTIKWHKKCFDNWGKSLDREEKELMSRLETLNQARIKHEFYRQQIVKAESEKRDGFDSERYMVKKPNN